MSASDLPSDLLPLEADYRSLGVREIVFIAPRKKRVRHLVKEGTDYDEAFLTEGALRLASVPGFVIEVEWLFADPKPNRLVVIQRMVAAAEADA